MTFHLTMEGWMFWVLVGVLVARSIVRVIFAIIDRNRWP